MGSDRDSGANPWHRDRVKRAHALLTAGLWAAVVLPVQAQIAVTETWDDFAVVSSTMGANQSRLCAGADRGDLGCPTYAPSLTTAGDVSVTGNLSANRFIGDGSGLTGLSTLTDRITSGTNSIYANTGMNTISFTTAGTERMAINSAGNLGIGTTSPVGKLNVNVGGYTPAFATSLNRLGTLSFAGYENYSVPAANLPTSLGFNTIAAAGVNSSAANDGLTVGLFGDSYGRGGNANTITVGGLFNARNFSSGGGMAAGVYVKRVSGAPTGNNYGIYVAGGETNFISGSLGIGTTNPARTLDVSGSAQITSRTLIGGSGTPSTTLTVSGSLLLAGDAGQACDNTTLGVLRRNPTTGRLQVCK